jgi:hypothetical protein
MDTSPDLPYEVRHELLPDMSILVFARQNCDLFFSCLPQSIEAAESKVGLRVAKKFENGLERGIVTSFDGSGSSLGEVRC